MMNVSNVEDPELEIACGHGLRREMASYRGVRIFEMNCGEVRCSLSSADYFQPDYIHEWIDGALDAPASNDRRLKFALRKQGWSEMDMAMLKSLRKSK